MPPIRRFSVRIENDISNLRPDSDALVVKFSLPPYLFYLHVSREFLMSQPVGSLASVKFKPDQPFEHSGKIFPFIVFSARVTPTFELEQAGSGFPCVSESHADSIVEVIRGKNQDVPHVGLISWEGGFAIGTLTNIECVQNQMVLFALNSPKIIDGQQCGFYIRIYKCFIDKPRELESEIPLMTIDPKIAQEIFQKKDREMAMEHSRKVKEQAIADGKLKSQPSLLNSQLEVLAKAYPDTVELLKNPDPSKINEIFAAYQRETLALTGTLIGTSLDKSEFMKTALALMNSARRKNPGINPIMFQLVAGWRHCGYDRMTPEQRFKDLKARGLQPSTPDAVRKMCERLKLPKSV